MREISYGRLKVIALVQSQIPFSPKKTLGLITYILANEYQKP
jgi:hypothetical protein